MPKGSAIHPAPSRLPRRFLSPAGLFVVTEPCEVTTILGPCVAVTFWCRHSRLAIICHAMLPSNRSTQDHATRSAGWKYVDAVIPEMWTRFLHEGGNPSALEVKLFGGADLLYSAGQSHSARIGPQNVEVACQQLAALGLDLAASDVGGKTGRKLIFNTQTGGVRVRCLPNNSRPPL